MQLFINGNQVNVPATVETISDVKEHFYIDSSVVIVEHNGDILDKEVHLEKKVYDGDKIELIQFVGGG